MFNRSIGVAPWTSGICANSRETRSLKAIHAKPFPTTTHPKRMQENGWHTIYRQPANPNPTKHTQKRSDTHTHTHKKTIDPQYLGPTVRKHVTNERGMHSPNSATTPNDVHTALTMFWREHPRLHHFNHNPHPQHTVTQTSTNTTDGRFRNDALL